VKEKIKKVSFNLFLGYVVVSFLFCLVGLMCYIINGQPMFGISADRYFPFIPGALVGILLGSMEGSDV
jgi:hypothetical protein